MNSWHLTPVFFLYLFVVAITIFVSVSSWRMRAAKGALEFSLMTSMAIFWTLGYMLGIFNSDHEWKLLMFRVQYFGLISTIYFWLLFSISYSNYFRVISLRIKLLLAIIPVISFTMVLTIPFNNIFYKSFQFVEDGGLLTIESTYGIGFYIWIITCFLYTIAGAVIMVLGVVSKPKFYRKQIIPLSILVIFVLLPTILSLTGNNPIAPYDPTPLSFAFVGLFLLFQFKYYKFFDLVPVAHETVFKSVQSAVLTIDQKRRILEMNPKAELIFNKSQNAVLGKPLEELFPENRKVIDDILTDSDKTAEVVIGSEKSVFEIMATPIKHGSSVIVAWVVILHNISQLKITQYELEAFARTVAHDLKGPLANQKGFLDLIQMNNTEGEVRQKYFDIIKDSAEKMITIVDNILLLSTVRNITNIEIVALNMNEILKSVISRLAIEKSLQLNKPDTWPVVFGNPCWIEEVWCNLISNALKYGGAPPMIELGVDIQSKFAKFWVKDNGEGLTKEEQASIFTEFNRLGKHSSKTQGHGIGLSIVSRIIQKHNGEVGVISNKDKGSTFYFTLPLSFEDQI